MSPSGGERPLGPSVVLRRFEFWPAWLAAIVLSLPALAVGPFADDFLRHLLLEGKIPEFARGPSELYDFTRGEPIGRMVARGFAPWQAHPELSLRFFRPLSSLLVAADHAVFGRAQLPGILLNIAWFLSMFWVVTLLFEKLLPRGPRGLAGLIYVLASGHAINIGWVSTRHLMIGATFAFAAVYWHVRWRESHPTRARWWHRWAALVALVLGMLSSESFLGGAVFIVCYELLDRTGPRRSRLARALPTLALSTAYVVGYTLLGYGPRHSGLYISPLADPAAFLRALVERWPVLLGELAGAFPSGLWVMAPGARLALLLLSVLALALLMALAKTASFAERERRRLRFLASAAALSCLPMVGGVLNGRMLVIPMLGSSAVVAWCIHRHWQQLRGVTGRWLFKVGIAVLVVLHLGLGPWVRLGTMKTMRDLAEGQRALAETFDDRGCEDGYTALLLTGSDPSLSLTAGAPFAYYRPELFARVPEMHVLSMAPHDLDVTRSDEATLLLTLTDLPRRSNSFERIFNDEPIEVGDEVVFGKLSARVLSAEDGLPTRVRFRIPQRSCLLMLDGGRLKSAPLPGVGELLHVRYEPGLFGL